MNLKNIPIHFLFEGFDPTPYVRKTPSINTPEKDRTKKVRGEVKSKPKKKSPSKKGFDPRPFIKPERLKP